jgi:hypothetical protein
MRRLRRTDRQLIFIVTIIGMMGFIRSAASGADLPATFRGVWMYADGSNETCIKDDWKGPAASKNDRIVNVTSRAIAGWESGCDFKSVKLIKTPNGFNSTVVDTVIISMSCSGEEQVRSTAEIWHLHSVAGQTLLVTVDSKTNIVSVFQKCP